MIRINILEDCVPVKRNPATTKEVFEAALVMILATAVFSALIIVILHGIVSIFAD